MRYHDFHLAGYEVRDYGGTILLHLVYDYTGRPKEDSLIRFSEVAAYHFVHTGGAIITDLTELPLSDLLLRVGDRLVEWWRQHGGYHLWDDDREKYGARLGENGYRAWTIVSAIGFEGFVIAKAVAEEVPNKPTGSNSP
ncbi:MAG: hypothetical protein JNN07_24185 [Verrucomicrobiales bacterium]|nr:hypothetical protein [Verrucomicrobiales bacterium]